ncbi:hypothetical protein ACJIZ3_002101 [Penstemon smallii]|uniref:DUF8204 domain-containing protein n=1 Tax=Penstemon smallii TaxID=265156 RepID=A0ABD3U968_9LAMI
METERMKVEEQEKLIIAAQMAASSSSNGKLIINSKEDDSNQVKQDDGSTSASSSIKNPIAGNKAKSCKGCLYYSSRFKADSRNPLCVGLPRSLPNVPRYIVGQSEMEAAKEGRRLADFRYACVGYSLYTEQKKHGPGGQETRIDLPVCIGVEVLVDRPVSTADSVSAPSHIHNKEDGNRLPQRRSPKPTNSTTEDFLNRFSRNAGLVANGVVKNVRRVGNQIKQSVDNILYPYKRRPK